ncbi:MAG: family transporter [Nocardioidaceae bacterium]|nr:family transporter [Nocardioidaceae bacterium]
MTSPHAPSRTLTARIAAHPRRSLLAVLLFAVVAGAFGGPVAGALDSSGGFAAGDADSQAAYERLEAAAGQEPSPGIVLVVDTPGGPAAATQRIAEVTAELQAQRGIATVTSPTTGPDSRPLTSRDGTQAMVLATLAADTDGEAVAEEVLDAFDGAEDVAVGGGEVAGLQIGDTVGEDLARAETLALPVLVLLSLIFFRGRAAVMPVVVGATTVLGTFLTLAGINQFYGLSVFALNLVIGLGLGLAIDYTLFLVTRYREELAAQGATSGAVAATMRTAGRTVAFSAATVAAAMITLTVFPLGFVKSMGIAGAVVAVVAAGASLVISPALFGLWGPKLALRSRRTRRAPAEAEQGRWYRLSSAVMRRPGTVAAATALVMLALAVPSARVNWTPIDDSVVPTDQSARTVSDAIDEGFGGSGGTPVIIAVQAGPDATDDVAAYAAQLTDLNGVTQVAPPVDLGSDTWQVNVTASGEPAGAAARDLVAEIRGLDPGFTTLVTGPAAEFVDQQSAIGSRLALALTLLVGLTLLVLWLMTGSVVLPVKAVIMNGLTVAAALGVLTFVYQDGRLTGLLGYTPNGGIEPTDFLVTAAIVFALSTDYGVFLLGRIKEARDAGAGESESVALGLQRTGRVVTAAAILLAVAIGAFSTSSISFIQQIGVATAVGVLIDAFVVRSLLVPALMGLLGKWNWWAPMPLRRLHDRVALSEQPAPVPVPAVPERSAV